MFPPPEHAVDGLLCYGGDLSTETLIAAYNHGCFPWFNEDDPIYWWHPDPRLLLLPKNFKCRRSLYKTLKKSEWEVKFDSDFESVIHHCAATPRHGQNGTWISDEMIEAYIQLYRKGFAHSVEVFWQQQLVGGLYGVLLGNAYFGESMFSHKKDASKVGLAYLVRHALEWKLDFIDCQIYSEHLASFGAQNVSRQQFISLLNDAKVKNEPQWIFNSNLVVTDIYHTTPNA